MLRQRTNKDLLEESEESKEILKKVEGVQRRRSRSFGQSLLRLFGFAVLTGITYRYWLKQPAGLVEEFEHAHSPMPEEYASVGSGMFEVADLPGRGKGLVALRDIEQGELVIKEKALFVVPNTISAGTSPQALIAQKMGQLGPADQERFMNLSYVKFPEDLDPVEHPAEVALAIFQTNAVAVGHDLTGIFPRMARLNHGCSSAFNVVYTWRAKEEVLVVHALKSIKKGDELLTTYMNTRRPRSERRDILKANYGFDCSCPVCSLSDAQSQTSDDRLVGISNHYDRLASWARKEIDGATAMEIVRKMWRVEDEEGYWSERGRLAADAAFVAAAHSDATATKGWAQLAVEWYGYEIGADSEQAEEMNGIIEDPYRHPGWGSREAEGVGGPKL